MFTNPFSKQNRSETLDVERSLNLDVRVTCTKGECAGTHARFDCKTAYVLEGVFSCFSAVFPSLVRPEGGFDTGTIASASVTNNTGTAGDV